METSLRRMGNSTGLIVPRAMLNEMGLASGARLDVRVEDGRIVAAPVERARRTGWGEAAAALADEDDAAAEWRGFGNEGDADLRW